MLSKFNLSIIVLSTFVAGTAFAAKTTTTTTTTRTTSTQPVERSQKKIEADRVGLSGPQVLEQGDNLIGVRVNQGGIFADNSVVGLSYERMVRPNLGLGLQARYTSYSNRWSSTFFSGRYDYTATTIAATGNLHADVFKVRNLDTFATAGLGHTFLTSRWSSSDQIVDPGTGDASTTFLLAYINARYFVDSSWSFTASLGTGLGTLGLGMDYLF